MRDVSEYRVVSPTGSEGWPVHDHDQGTVFGFAGNYMLDLRHNQGPRPSYLRGIWNAAYEPPAAWVVAVYRSIKNS